MARIVIREGEKVRFTGQLRHQQGCLRFGRSMGADVRIVDQRIDKVHARLEVRGRRVFVVDASRTSGTFVNDAQAYGPMPIKPTDEVRIGDARFSIEAAFDTDEVASHDAKNEEFLDAIARDPKDQDLRSVYADWLEENGEPQRAELLRLQNAREAIEDATFKDHENAAFKKLELKMEALSKQEDGWWRALTSRAPIEKCAGDAAPELKFECPKRWSELEVTPRDTVRFCNECKREVYYCASLSDVRVRGSRGECVAFDSSLRRKRALTVYDEGEIHNFVMGEVA